MVFTGPATDEILDLQFVKFVVFAGPTTDEIVLDSRFVRLVGFAEPVTDEWNSPVCQACGLCWAYMGRSFGTSLLAQAVSAQGRVVQEK